MKHPFRSIRWRLLLWQSLISLTLVVAVALLADRLVSREKMERVDRETRNFERLFFRKILIKDKAEDENNLPSLNEMRAELRTLAETGEASSEFEGLFQTDPESTYIAFWDTDGSPLFISRNAPPSLEMPKFSSNDSPSRDVDHDALHEHHRKHPIGLTIVIGRDISAELESLRRFRILLGLGGAALLLVALAGSWWFAGRALRPVESISRTASRIAAGNLDERIATDASETELDQLGNVLNNTFERLGSLIEQQKRFTADASHELRTPLTVILSETQRALKRDREPAEYQAIISHCRTAAKRMQALVDSLLLLARQDLQSPAKNPPTIDLAAAANAVADLLEPIAAERSIKMHRDLAQATVCARPEMLEILLQNLLGNAIAHPPKGTPVTIRTATVGDHALIEIHDEGPGIPAEHLPHLFDRFYRADAARTHGSGHSGLGLAIARSISETLDGKIEVESSAESGTTFRVKLPLQRESQANV